MIKDAKANSINPTVQNGNWKPPIVNSIEPIIGPESMPKPVNVYNIPFILASFFSGNRFIKILDAKVENLVKLIKITYMNC